jgi:hypothetical protein
MCIPINVRPTVVAVLNETPYHEGVRCGGTAPRIFNFGGDGWASFTCRPLYPDITEKEVEWAPELV